MPPWPRARLLTYYALPETTSPFDYRAVRQHLDRKPPIWLARVARRTGRPIRWILVQDDEDVEEAVPYRSTGLTLALEADGYKIYSGSRTRVR